MNIWKIYLFVFCLTLTGYSQVSELKIHSFSGTVVFSLDGGLTLSKTDYPDQDIGGRLTGGVEYYLPVSGNHIFGIRGFAGGQQVNSKGTKTISGPATGSVTLPHIINSEMYVAGISLIYSFSINDEFFPYLSPGISNIWFSPKTEDGIRAPNNSANKYERTSIVYDLELGVRYSLTENISIKIEGGFHFPDTDYLDDVTAGNSKDFYATALAGISYSLYTNKDSDEDGILNNVDKCPDEPEDFDGFQDEDGCPDHDNDGDGIPDILDRCPDTPEDFDGFQDEDGCPDIDNDGDQIRDELDECPDEAEDFDGFQDEDGCPDPDNDGDGVLDAEDKCPSVPGPRSNDGCPDRETTEYIIAPKEIVIEGEATFASEKSDILPEAQNELNRIVKILQLYPDMNWRIEGHTDIEESENLMVRSLSLRRAEAILNYFVSKGLPSYQFRVYDMGDKFPIANNNTEYGRMKNRRVVLVREN